MLDMAFVARRALGLGLLGMLGGVIAFSLVSNYHLSALPWFATKVAWTSENDFTIAGTFWSGLADGSHYLVELPSGLSAVYLEYPSSEMDVAVAKENLQPQDVLVTASGELPIVISKTMKAGTKEYDYKVIGHRLRVVSGSQAIAIAIDSTPAVVEARWYYSSDTGRWRTHLSGTNSVEIKHLDVLVPIMIPLSGDSAHVAESMPFRVSSPNAAREPTGQSLHCVGDLARSPKPVTHARGTDARIPFEIVTKNSGMWEIDLDLLSPTEADFDRVEGINDERTCLKPSSKRPTPPGGSPHDYMSTYLVLR